MRWGIARSYSRKVGDMWTKLTRHDGDAVLVNVDRLTHVVPRTGGGSSLFFARGVDQKSDATQVVLATRETVVEINDLIGAGRKAGHSAKA